MGKFMEHIILKYLVVPKAPQVLPDKKHIACIGDSITFGAGVSGKKEKTWEYSLEKLLREKYQVLNYGISGRTLQDEGDYPYTVEKFYRISKETAADIYIIMLGTNDAKPYNWDRNRYERELPEFVKSYMDLPNRPRVILMTPPKCYVDPKLGKVGYDISGEVVAGPIYDIVRETADKLSLEVIDLHSFTDNHNEWFDDGVHPNETGDKAIAGYIAQALGLEQ